MLTLGIETSCDDTSLAIIEEGVRIRAGIVSSQTEIHRRFGGVVPEVASRKHLEAFPPLLRETFLQAGIGFSDIDQIAVTAGPGLLGSLLVGLAAAKALSWSLKKPLIPVNHLEAHLDAAFLAFNREPAYPYLGLIVSGGHSNLVIAEGQRKFTRLGRTVDDAPGELFDKAARFLKLGYPGGPEIQRVSATGAANRYPLPRPMRGKGYGFSFSGLKTAVMNIATSEGESLDLPGLCASLQTAVAETLLGKAETAVEEFKLSRLVVAGGVAANKTLREHFQGLADRRGLELLIPPPSLCTDNAAMIGTTGFFTSRLRPDDALSANARADWPMGGSFDMLR